MKKCPYCAEEIQDEAVVCRYCGRDLVLPPVQVMTQPHQTQPQRIAPKPLSTGMKVLISIIVFVVVILWAVGTQKSGISNGVRSDYTYEKCVDIIDSSGDHSYDYLTIEGTIKNICDHSISYIELTGYAYNQNEVQVGSDWTYADSNELPPGAQSQFTIMMKVPDGQLKYKVIVTDWDN